MKRILCLTLILSAGAAQGATVHIRHRSASPGSVGPSAAIASPRATKDRKYEMVCASFRFFKLMASFRAMKCESLYEAAILTESPESVKLSVVL